jgi:predicted TIM-barrel fold metal-dependent hydrolase
MTTSETSFSEIFDSIKVIDADTHYSEPHDLWTKRAPPAMKGRVPRVETVDGVLSWVIDDSLVIGAGATASSSVTREGLKPPGLACVNWRNEDVHAGSYDVRARLGVMDNVGIFAQIVYPNILGFGGQHTSKVDPALRLLSVQIYNDAMAEMQFESGQRIYPMALLPWWDVKEAVAETKRCQSMGLRGININTDPQTHKGPQGDPSPDLSQPYWDPLWDICTSLDLPINFHIGASEQAMDWMGMQGWPGLSFEMRAALGGSMLFLNNGRVVGNLILSGLLDRYPNLKFVSVESGIGWIPFILESLNFQYAEITTARTLKLAPSEYFRRNFYACFWFEQWDLRAAIERVGADNCMFETDFPHPTCLYPAPLARSKSGLATLDKVTRRKVLSDTAARIYKIDLGHIPGHLSGN